MDDPILEGNSLHNQNPKGLDILSVQDINFKKKEEVLSEKPTKPVIDDDYTKVRFTKIGDRKFPQPTELSPLDEADIQINTTKEEVKAKEKSPKDFSSMMNDVGRYLGKIMTDRQGVKFLKLDLSVHDNPENYDEVVNAINNAAQSNVINQNEHSELLTMLGEKNIEENAELLKAPIKSLNSQIIESDEKTPEIMKSVIEDDSSLEIVAIESYKNGNLELALDSIDKIKDIDTKSYLLRDFVADFVHQGKFDLARICINHISDLTYKLDLTKWMIGVETSHAPKSPSVEEKPKEEDIHPMIEESKIPEIMEVPIVVVPKEVTKPEIPKEKTVEELQVESKTTEENLEAHRLLDANLEKARDEYAKLYIEWETKTREAKGLFSKTLSELGVSRPVPERLSIKTSALEDAKDEYLKARAARRENFPTEAEKLWEAALSEREALDSKMNELRPVREKGKIEKATLKVWDKYKKLPPAARLAIPTALMVGGGVAFGTLGAANLVGYVGYRAARTGAGLISGSLSGKVVDKIQNTRNEDREAVAREEYAEKIGEESLSEKERKLTEFFEKQNDIKKRQKLYKAGVMVGSGIAAYGAAGSVMEKIDPGITTNPGIFGGLKKMFSFDKLVTKVSPNLPPTANVENLYPPTITAPIETDTSVVDQIPKIGVPAKVELTPMGMLDDIHHLKEKIIEQYGGEQKVPENLRVNVLSKPSVVLAKEFHLYDPNHHVDVHGVKGESLGLDDKGNIFYEHLDGKKQILFSEGTVNTPTSNLKDEINNIIPLDTPKAEVVAEAIPLKVVPVEINEETIAPAVTPEAVVHNLETAPKTISAEVMSSSLANGNKIPYHDSFVNIVDKNGAKSLEVYDTEFARETVFRGKKIYSLLDGFQDGTGYVNPRHTLNEIIDYSSLAKTATPIEFEGGVVYILEGFPDDPNGVSVLLNGKEIAKGIAEAGKFKVDLINQPSMKSGWLMGDTVYERAFKTAQNVLKVYTKSGRPPIN